MAVRDGTIDRVLAPTLVVIAAVWVDPSASDEEAVFANNAAAVAE